MCAERLVGMRLIGEGLRLANERKKVKLEKKPGWQERVAEIDRLIRKNVAKRFGYQMRSDDDD